MVKVQPFGDKVAVQVITEEETDGLLVKPVSKESSNKGIVVAVGEGITLQDGTVKPLSVQVGDKVIFNPNLGMKFKDEKGELYRVLQAREILCKLIEVEEK